MMLAGHLGLSLAKYLNASGTALRWILQRGLSSSRCHPVLVLGSILSLVSWRILPLHSKRLDLLSPIPSNPDL